MVRLKECEDCKERKIMIEFQFLMVRLKVKMLFSIILYFLISIPYGAIKSVDVF